MPREFLTQDLSEVNVIFIHSTLDEVGLTASQFRIYAHLARRSNQVGKAWPGVDSMASVCRMHKETVIECIKQLEDLGMIRVQRRPGLGNVYHLTSPSVWRLSEMGNGTNQSEMGNGVVGRGERNQSEMGNVSISKEGNPKKETHSADAETLAICFGEFWQAYPRKTAKAAAEKAFAKKGVFDNIEAILKAIEAHKKTDQWQRGIVPHPATWLNQKRWNDDLTHDETRRSKDNSASAARGPEKRGGEAAQAAASQYAGLGQRVS